MQYSTDRIEDVMCLELRGDLWGGWETFRLKDEVTGWIRNGDKRYLIDLGGRHLNSTGIGVLVAALVSSRNAGAELKLCGVCKRARRAMQVAGVWGLFSVYFGREEALCSWGVGVAA